ncbi:MAG TPA: AAA family ATPase, partial [Phenylobacterium sp.]|nr:AAA family ATPase [Phenylobacterium sp.]
ASERALVRIDMSEYREPHTVARLIGSPPGYVGYGEGGQLTEPVRRRPYSVILLDEIEKAHPEVWNVLLQLMDDGRLTDGEGRTVDFTNAVIVMTSNLGTADLRKANLGFTKIDEAVSYERMKEKVNDALKVHFRPEFLNRIDEIILFKRLGRAEMDNIVRIQLQRVEKLLADRRMSIALDAAATHWIAERGYDPVYGARPLKRVIQKDLVDPIARKLLAGDLQDGSVIDVSATDEGLQIGKAKVH